MQQYFTHEQIEVGSSIQLDKDDCHHIINVMRMTTGDHVRISDHQRLYIGELFIEKSSVGVTIVEALDISTELPQDITLIISLIKGSNFDLVIQKATELGVRKIVPFQAERSVVKVNDKFHKKMQRFEKIAIEAAEQSERVSAPEMCLPIKLDEMKHYMSEENIILYERQQCSGLLKSVTGKHSVTIIIGPEGGFSPSEAEAIISLGFTPASLGKRILRAETAAINALSVIGSVIENVHE